MKRENELENELELLTLFDAIEEAKEDFKKALVRISDAEQIDKALLKKFIAAIAKDKEDDLKTEWSVLGNLFDGRRMRPLFPEEWKDGETTVTTDENGNPVVHRKVS